MVIGPIVDLHVKRLWDTTMHATKKCLTNRFPYFSVDYVEIPNDVKGSLRDSHKKYLTSEFGLTFEWNVRLRSY